MVYENIDDYKINYEYNNRKGKMFWMWRMYGFLS